MIFKLKFSDKTEFAQAKNQLHLLQSYSQEYDDFLDIEEVEELTDEQAKAIMLTNTEYNEDLAESDDNAKEFSLFDYACGDDFLIIGSSEWV